MFLISLNKSFLGSWSAWPWFCLLLPDVASESVEVEVDMIEQINLFWMAKMVNTDDGLVWCGWKEKYKPTDEIEMNVCMCYNRLTGDLPDVVGKRSINQLRRSRRVCLCVCVLEETENNV